MTALDGKVVAITGAGRGIGREIALLCAREGAAVVVNDIGAAWDGAGSDSGPAERTVADIRAAGGRAHANLASVTDPEGAASIVADAVAIFGRIDAVVNNAGILRNRPWEEMTFAEWRTVLDVHLDGSFHVARAATPHFVAQRSGSFIHFTSSSGLIGQPEQANYSAAKLGIVGLSQTIALDLAKYNIRSNCVAPWAFTRLMENMMPDVSSVDETMVAGLKELGAEKIAPLVAYLASDAASDITNQVFGVRKNEIMLFSKPRPLRSVARTDGWTVASIADQLMPAFRPSLTGQTDDSVSVFPYDPL